MKKRSVKRQRGFSLLEMVVATAIGSIVLGAALQTYVQGVNATWTVTQRAEMQQDFRAASNILTKDLSLAGAGLGNGTPFALALPSSSTPQYGCDQTPKCYINSVAGTYPLQGTTPYMYGLLTGYNKGPTLVTAQGPTDVITVVYADPTFYLSCYNIKVSAVGVVTFSTPSVTWAQEGCLPNGVASPQAVNDTVAGLTVGDLVLLNFGGTNVVGEVTGPVTVSGTSYSVPFANSDVLKMNQTPSASVSNPNPGLNSVSLNTTGTYQPFGTCTCRLQVVTYYLDNTVTPSRLMRQVNGHSPVPVAENVVYMKFTYDLFNDSTSTPAVGCQNPGGSGDVCVSGSSSGLLPDQITKINIVNMALDSTQYGTRFGQNGYQRIDLQTSVSARNLSYINNYNN